MSVIQDETYKRDNFFKVKAEKMVATASVLEASSQDTRAPNGLAEIKAKMVDFFVNPMAYLDRAKAISDRRYDYDKDAWVDTLIFDVPSLESVIGLEMLGNGGYARVYALPCGKRVLKVLGPNGDRGYERFVTVAMQHQSNPYFPKIFYKGTWGGRRVFVLERLELNLPDEEEGKDIKNYLRDAILTARNPFLTHANRHMKELAEALKDSDCTSDLHNGNIMFRGTTPVVTDPAT